MASFESYVEPELLALDLSENKMSSILEFARLKNSEYLNNNPYPHIVIDNFFPDKILREVAQEIEEKKEYDGKRMNNTTLNKFTLSDLSRMGPYSRRLLQDMNSSQFCKFIEELTGFSGIIPDPHLFGGGIHEIKAGGFLKVHADFNYHKKLDVHRRVNCLLYLNEGWKEEWGGHIELWDRDVKKKVAAAAPIFNRMVLFSTTEYSYHGHPDPIDCPDDQSRKSLALYYYTSSRDEGEIESVRIDTDYQNRPGENAIV